MTTPKLHFDSAREYWDHAANTYETDFTGTVTGRARRTSVWNELDRVFCRGQRILELNCGTGIDAIYLATRGIRVLACDISPRMIEIAVRNAKHANVLGRIDFRVLPTESIDTLASDGLFEGAFSNFAGLNCVEDLSAVVRDLAVLLEPGSPVLINVMGTFVAWEIAWFLLRGQPQKAFRRVRRRETLSWGPLTIRRLPIQVVTSIFEGEGFTRRAWKGIGVAVPPSYLEHWACRFPTVLEGLSRLDERIGRLPFFRRMADCCLLEFESNKPKEFCS